MLLYTHPHRQVPTVSGAEFSARPIKAWPVHAVLQKWFRQILTNIWCCRSYRSRASWVCPEVSKTKCNPAAWMDFPPGEQEKLVKLSINMKNLWEQGQECQHYFFNHTSLWNIWLSLLWSTLCADCTNFVRKFAGMLYYSYQQLCPTLQWQLNSLCKMRQSRGNKTLHSTGFPCALNVLGWDNTSHAPARCGKEDLHLTWEISPAQYNITPVAKSWGEQCVTDVYTGLKRSIPAVL